MTQAPSLHPRRRRMLWSGGFDSTAMLVRALRAGDHVEAHYIVDDPTWWKRKNEVEARERILAALPAHLRGLLTLAPLEDTSRQIVAARYEEHHYRWYRHVWEAGFDWRSAPPAMGLFSAAAAVLGPGLEIGITGCDEGTFGGGYRAMADTFRAQAGLVQPLGSLTKLDLLAEARAEGWEHLLLETWTCDEDVRIPCGVCGCCRRRVVEFRRGAAERAA